VKTATKSAAIARAAAMPDPGLDTDRDFRIDGGASG
jgi:hypothetical protein